MSRICSSVNNCGRSFVFKRSVIFPENVTEVSVAQNSFDFIFIKIIYYRNWKGISPSSPTLLFVVLLLYLLVANSQGYSRNIPEIQSALYQWKKPSMESFSFRNELELSDILEYILALKLSNDTEELLASVADYKNFVSPVAIRSRHRRVTSSSRNFTWPIKRVTVIEGDITLGGLMMVHEREDQMTCGPIMPQGGIQALECMLYTLDWVNKQDFLPGIKLGAYVLDDCDKDTYGLEQAVDFIRGSISNIDDETYHCKDGSSPTVRHTRISGVLGAASSVTSIQVANLLRLFKIPQVSFFSTSPELSNKQRFEYFMRTVPSDTNQAHAMVEIVKRLNWTYISILYEESNYGIQAFTVLEHLLAKEEICIAVKERLTKDSGVAGEEYYDAIVKKITSKQKARGVIIFGSDQEVAGVMRAVRRNNLTGIFSWIGSDGWSARALVFEGNEAEVEGTLSVQPRAHPVKGFDDYFLNLTVQSNSRNPWFTEFWEHFFNCKWPNSSITPYNQKYKKMCTGEETMSYDTGYEPENQVKFVSDAVLAFAYALRNLHKDVCGPQRGLCDRMKPIDGLVLLNYLKNVSFKGLSGEEFQFTELGDGPARYNIIHFKKVSATQYQWVKVGEYHEGQLELNLSHVQFRMEEPVIPQSVCSLPCSKGQVKKFVESEKCCWHCFNCSRYQIIKTETECFECPSGYLPDDSHENCDPIAEVHMRPDSTWAIGAMIFSSVGIIITSFVIIVFIKHQDTPVVKASGRELSYVLLGGILMCYGVTFLLVQRPTDLLCRAQEISTGLCFAVVYSAILTKTNRIFRIFHAGARSRRKPSYISPKSQLCICGALVFVQLLVTVSWMYVTSPRAIHYYPTREENHLICSASIYATHMVAFAYPILLIIICTVYAVLTRKIPEAFNESKYIGFTMYTTCIIWLAFIPLYFTTTTHVEMNVTTMSVTISLSATVTLVCLFTPKLYTIVLHPEKNIRQSLMNQNKFVDRIHVTVPTGGVNLASMPDASLLDHEAHFKRSPSPAATNCSTQTDLTLLRDLKQEEKEIPKTSTHILDSSLNRSDGSDSPQKTHTGFGQNKP